MPIQMVTSPYLHLDCCLPDFFSAKLETECPIENGLAELRLKLRLSILGCWLLTGQHWESKSSWGTLSWAVTREDWRSHSPRSFQL